MSAAAPSFRPNRFRGPANAWMLSVTAESIDRALRSRKRRLLEDLPDEVVELGPGVGANFRYLRPGTRVIAIEPNPAMHARLRAEAAAHELTLDLRTVAGERLEVEDGSVPAVISSLVLCTVADPAAVVGEVLRVLQPGGRYSFLEHVAAPEGSPRRRLQRAVRRPWAWTFEGCSCERDLAAVIEGAGFEATDIERYRVRTPLLPFNTQIAGTATKAG